MVLLVVSGSRFMGKKNDFNFGEMRYLKFSFNNRNYNNIFR